MGLRRQSSRDPSAGLAGVVAISAGSYHSLALRSDGTVVAWGVDSDGLTRIPKELAMLSPLPPVDFTASRYARMAPWFRGDMAGIIERE